MFRRKKNRTSNIELKSFNHDRRSVCDPSATAESGPLPVRPPRVRSLDRTTSNNLKNENVRPANWQPQVNAIKEVVVPASPANRKWAANSPIKLQGRGRSKTSYDWTLAMFVFGGREQGVSSVYKSPISVWKLYV